MAGLLPAATMVLAMLLSVEPLHLYAYAAVAPAFTLIAAYHWTLYRPDLLPSAVLFAVGTAEDLLSGGLPGATALVLLLGRALLLRQRHRFIDRSFLFVWAGFSLLTAIAALFLWALHSLLAGELLDFRVAALGAVLTIFVFPLASFPLGRAQRAMMDPK